MEPALARYIWQLIEPVHAVVYFAPDAIQISEEAGLKGGWMTYFAGRSAPMGAVGPEVVTATFYNFHPAMVARSIPDAWKLSSPEKTLSVACLTAAGIDGCEAHVVSAAVGAVDAGTQKRFRGPTTPTPWGSPARPRRILRQVSGVRRRT